MEAGDKPSDAVSSSAEDVVLSQSQTSSGSSDSNGDPQTIEHPLLNPVIVDLVVKCLDPDFEQMKTLRLVSKVWKQATQHHWRNSCGALTLVPDPPNFSKSKYETGVSVSSFLKEFQDPESPFQLSQKPFSKYKLKDFTLDLEVCNDSDGPAFKFWNSVGPLMKSVHFYRCLYERSAEGPNATCPRVQFLARMIPNLKDLVLTDMTTPEAEEAIESERDEYFNNDEFQYPDIKKEPLSKLQSLTVIGDLKNNLSLSELLKSAPILEVISGVDQILIPLLNPIYRVRYHSETIPRPLSKLKHLDLINSSALLCGDFPWGLVPMISPIPPEQVLIGLQVPLETLSLHLENFDPDTEYWDYLDIYLKSFSSTLKTLKVFQASAGPPYAKFLFNVSMSSLKELDLCGTIAPNLEFLKSTPNLKKLRVDLGCFEKYDVVKKLIRKYNEDTSENCKFKKYQLDMVAEVDEDLKEEILCSELEYFEIDFEFPEESLRLLSKWMPNLKTLKTILNVGTIPVVCEVWRELTELVCLHGSKVDNNCFIRDEEKAGFSGAEAPPPKLKICHLNDLERFQLDTYCGESELTDEVVYNGFLKMSRLKSVEICVKPQMSAEAEEALRKGIQFCKVVRDNAVDCCGPPGSGIVVPHCRRCIFRLEAIYGLRDYEDEDSSGNEESDDGEIHVRGRHSEDSSENEESDDGEIHVRGRHSEDSDDEEFSGSQESNSSMY